MSGQFKHQKQIGVLFFNANYCTCGLSLKGRKKGAVSVVVFPWNLPTEFPVEILSVSQSGSIFISANPQPEGAESFPGNP